MTTSPDLFWLAATCIFTALLWVPYVANRFRELGPPGWGWFPQPDPPPRTPWAERAMRAHMNAVENLVVFGPLVVAIAAAGWGSTATAAACRIYFWARITHFAVSLFGLPIALRTIAFLTGVGAQLVLGWTVLTLSG